MSNFSDYYNNKVATGSREMINEENVGWDFFLNDKALLPFYFLQRGRRETRRYPYNC